MSNLWSVAQACVWAATRDHIAVREVGPNDILLALNEGPLIEIAHVIAWREAVAGVSFPSVLEAAEVLLDHCQHGEVELLGRKNGKGTASPIPVNVLLRLEIADDSSRKEPIAQPCNAFGTQRDWWSDLTVDRSYVLKRWHQILSPPSEPTPVLRETTSSVPTVVAPPATEAEVAVWAKPIVDRIDADGRQITRTQFAELIREKFAHPDLSNKMIDKVWETSTPGGWRKGGQGRLPARKAVAEWRPYLVPKSRETN
jgi:hypothetical protein